MAHKSGSIDSRVISYLNLRKEIGIIGIALPPVLAYRMAFPRLPLPV